MAQVTEKYYKREFWARENLKYVEPHFRLTKAARILNSLARGRECELLDVGCGPATLKRLLQRSINYHGIDIAVHEPGPDQLEVDFLAAPIGFADKRFDLVVAQGVFEYVGSFQTQKLYEIRQLLKRGGMLVVSYVNFDHVHRYLYPPYSNILSFDEFRRSLAEVFHVDRVVPTSHHWHHHEPIRKIMKDIHMQVNICIPVISRLFAVEYFFICSLDQKMRKGVFRNRRTPSPEVTP